MRQGENLGSIGHCCPVSGDMSHTCLSSVPPHIQAHIPPVHTHPLPCKHPHLCFTSTLPHPPMDTLVFACRHTHSPRYPLTHPHKYIHMHAQAHCYVYIHAYAHDNTNTNQCTLTYSRHLIQYTFTHICFYTHFHTCAPMLTH